MKTPESSSGSRTTVCVPEPLTAAAATEMLQHNRGFRIVARERMREADVVLVSSESGDVDFVRSLRAVHEQGGTRVVVILGSPWTADLFTAVGLGLAAIVPRGKVSAGGLARTLDVVAKGGAVFPLDIQAVALRQMRVAQRVLEQRGMLACGLDTRELDLLRGLADGMSLDEIGARMCYSKRTVTNVLAGLTSRLGLRNRTQAVAYALRAGVL
ncbi:LuxR C-terminal-related transcriptional regulator [Umezawaea endophytica]|uniref:Response regulator transcription factor n=1 Tax=Umezawaea endophytica TaxID=1654476 RepID=A0A9X2VTC6_9PSEU|nr:response regulator transcription factor [Umezawaea endophytica]MCS7482485.1 response regulator transcription factor [Umezawaea endophytica]